MFISSSCLQAVIRDNRPQGTKNIYLHVIAPHWHGTGIWNPPSSKKRTCLFDILNIMGADVLAMQRSRASATMIQRFPYGSLGPMGHDHYGSQNTENGSYNWCFYSLVSLTLNVRGPSNLCLTRSLSWLLMPWLLTSPGHQHPWYWLCRIGKSLSYLRKDYICLCHINVE